MKATDITISHKKGLNQKQSCLMFTNPTHVEQRIGYVEGVIEWIDFN